MPLAAEIVDDEADLTPIRAGWDALAVAARRPYCGPGWMLAWWRNARPAKAGLRVVVVTEGSQVLGVMPLWSAREGGVGFARHGMLTERLSPPVGPLMATGREREVAEAMARALAASRPRPSLLRFWIEPAGSSPDAALARVWPRRSPWIQPNPRCRFRSYR